MEEAPLFVDLETVPATGRAVWRRCADGTRIRVGLWGGGRRGTILVFPGRTEYIEKYGDPVARLLDRGFSAAVVDWRGQGLSDRHPREPRLGWVRQFSDYQLDVAEMVATVAEAGLPAPRGLLAHSMGGAIGLRALLRGLPVERAIFSAPMWGIHVAPHLRLVAGLTAALGPLIGLGERPVPSGDLRNYVEIQPFEGNLLTNDRRRYEMLRAHLAAHPELGLGAPSIHWFAEARRECRRLAAEAPPPHPALTFLGTREGIVATEPIRRIMARWPNGRLVEIEGAQHEVLMEEDHVLEQVWSEIDSFLEPVS